VPLPETAIFGTFVGTLIILTYSFFRMEDDKKISSDKDLADTYKTLREKLLDPILQDIISIRKAKMDPAKFMNTPEVIEKLSRYRALLNDYNNTNRKQLGLIIPLHLASATSLWTGISAAVLTSINELYISTANNTSGITYLQIIILTTIILIIGSIFTGSLVLLYKKYNNEFREALNDVTRWFY